MDSDDLDSQFYVILKENITFTKNLGQGAFAEVKKGIWQKSINENIQVAVKVLFESNETVKMDLLNEINLLSKLKHPNLIRLYGIVLDEPLMMVTEFCDGGSLFQRLTDSKLPILLATEILDYSRQICNGMMYLEEKCYVHRDLATRNILLTNNNQLIKICDFGLSRIVDEKSRLYEMSSRKCVPIAWCAPESLTHRKFSSASDVWSFGVTLWEMWTNGDEPWNGIAVIDILRSLENGERLENPKNAPLEMIKLMELCWKKYPQQRPNFQQIYKILMKMNYQILFATKNFFHESSDYLEIQKNDEIICLEMVEDDEIFGQNVLTRFYGKIPIKFLDEKVENLPKIDSPMKPPRKTQKEMEDLVFTPPPLPPKPAKYGKLYGKVDLKEEKSQNEAGDEDFRYQLPDQNFEVIPDFTEEELDVVGRIPTPKTAIALVETEDRPRTGIALPLLPPEPVNRLSRPTTPTRSPTTSTSSKLNYSSITNLPEIPTTSNQPERPSTLIKEPELALPNFQPPPELDNHQLKPATSPGLSSEPVSKSYSPITPMKSPRTMPKTPPPPATPIKPSELTEPVDLPCPTTPTRSPTTSTPSNASSSPPKVVPQLPSPPNRVERSSTPIKQPELILPTLQTTPPKIEPVFYPSVTPKTPELPILTDQLYPNHLTPTKPTFVPQQLSPTPSTISSTCSSLQSPCSSTSKSPEAFPTKLPDFPQDSPPPVNLQKIPKKSALFQKEKDTQLKVNLQLAANRLKTIRNKKTELAMKARTEIVALVEAGHPERARIRVESIIREDFLSEAYEILELYCELLFKRFGILQEMQILEGLIAEAVISLIWASTRISADIQEMKIILKQFTERYGRAFVEAAKKNEITVPEKVLPKLIQKMNMTKPSDNLVEKYLIQICRYGNVKYIPNKKFITDEEIRILMS